ncbi:MAG: flagellar hook-basal body complex protein FliE [Ignavibacteria bacterium]|jgi:flagellar hook-basal body complex protein FliE|nr:flagellar hook-basal body complex protein FliE [Ignavibacteria bacterium]
MINEINAVSKYQPLLEQPKVEKKDETQNTSFADTMQKFIEEINASQIASNEITESFIKGEDVDLHDVTIAAQKAKTSFQLLLELRNKGIELYREVLRMQV